MTVPSDLEPILDDLRVGLRRRARRRRRRRAAGATVAAAAAAAIFLVGAGPQRDPADVAAPAAAARECGSALASTLPDYSTTLAACS